MTAENARRAALGEWVSIAPEIRPSSSRNADGTLRPFYLSRAFTAWPNDEFELTVVNSADPYGATPLSKICIKGHTSWHGEHPIAPGAQKVHFVADTAYDVTPIAVPFGDVLDKVAGDSYAKWEVGNTQSVLGKNLALFGLAAGENFMEHDLIYVFRDMLFWGARHVDGRGFDTEEDGPTNLRIPMKRR